MSAERRTGDRIAIPGDYQHRALTEGPAVQRFWHTAKLGLLDWALEVAAGERVLDVGSGSGVFADRMAARGAVVTGVDANEDAVRYATETFARPGLAFRHGLLDELGLEAESFEAATCLEVVEHVHPPQVDALFSDLHRLLVPGGRLLVTTPNYRGTWPALEWLTDRFGPAAKMAGDQHVTRFHRARLEDFLRRAGFELERATTYCTLSPFAAPLSWKLAAGLERLERGLPFGNLLVAVARRPAAD